MKKLKKISVLCLAVALVFSLAACGEKKEEPVVSDTPVASTTPEVKEETPEVKEEVEVETEEEKDENYGVEVDEKNAAIETVNDTITLRNSVAEALSTTVYDGDADYFASIVTEVENMESILADVKEALESEDTVATPVDFEGNMTTVNKFNTRLNELVEEFELTINAETEEEVAEEATETEDEVVEEEATESEAEEVVEETEEETTTDDTTEVEPEEAVEEETTETEDAE